MLSLFLATKITFINEIADLAEKAGAIVQEVARGIGMDIRIGSKFLHAGPRFGGSRFPKDARALIETHRIMTCLLGFTDDMRETRSIPFIAALQHMGSCCGPNSDARPTGLPTMPVHQAPLL